DNAVNQAHKEIQQRYDFKGTHCTIVFDRAKATIALDADDDFRMKQLLDVVQGRLVKRNVSLKNVKTGDIVQGAGTSVRRTLTLTQGIEGDVAKEIVRAVKAGDFKKVQVSIQGEELRVSSPSKDTLQEVMVFMRSKDF